MATLDAHCHFWRLDRGDYGWLAGEGGPLAPIRRDFEPQHYPGKGRFIAVQAAPSLAETDYLLALAKADPRLAGVVGWVDMAASEAVTALVERAKNPLFKGIRPMLQDIAATDWLLFAPRSDVLASVRDLGLRFDALVTTRHLAVVERFARQNPDIALIIDHAAKPGALDGEAWAEGMAALARQRHIHCKLSGLMTELSPENLENPLPALRATFSRLLDWFGPGRLVWGSDWPVLNLAASYDTWLELTGKLLDGLSAAEQAAIMGGNAARFYGVEA